MLPTRRNFEGQNKPASTPITEDDVTAFIESLTEEEVKIVNEEVLSDLDIIERSFDVMDGDPELDRIADEF